MYTPSHFINTDLSAMQATLRRHPFGLLITPWQGRVQLTHLPFHLDTGQGPKGTLEAHLARVNPHCEALLAGARSVVVFSGPHGYISPRWYVDPARNVPTWNYVAVHAHGNPQTTEDRDTLMAMIGRLTDEHESYIGLPWSIREAQAHAEHLAKHILGFTLEIEELEGKYKLSQNRSDGDRAGVMQALAGNGDSGAQEMLELMRGLYSENGSPLTR